MGSVALFAAASGALAVPASGTTDTSADGSLEAVPLRPQSDATTTAGALDPIAAAGESLSEESVATAALAHTTIVEQQRQEAAEAAARAEREAKRWVLPLSGYKVTATFGSGGRLWASRHTGIDLAAPSGTEVYSMSSGEIIFAGYDGSYGNKIVVRHWDGTETWYCHLSRFVQRYGDVEPGTLIGRVGSTGNSTGPHLHLEVHPDGGEPVNPRTWFADQGLNI